MGSRPSRASATMTARGDERTSAAIIVLLLFLLVMNGLAIYLRNRFEKRW